MKKTLSLLIVVLLFVPLLTLTACGIDEVKVESSLIVDSDFSGHRNIVIKFPRNIKIDSFKDTLIKNNPLKDSENSKFEYVGVEEDGYTFVMDIAFDTHDEYVSQVKALLKRDVTSFLSVSDTVLTKGVRVTEDFDVSELIAWIIDLSNEDDNFKNVEFDYSKNTVIIDDMEFETESTVDISERSGLTINSVTIETTNLKDGNYDRTITFSIPNKTYMGRSDDIKAYFKAHTMPTAEYCDFTNKGSSWEYKVIYKNLSIELMSIYTGLLLESDYADAYYGDRDNNSTPLSEGLVFEETLDTFKFIGPGGGSVDLVYKYALPTKTTHGEGKLYSNGKWSGDGAWKDGVYTLVVDTDSMSVRVPDGIQYLINGIRFDLDVVGKDSFVRTTEFLYSKTQGYDGMAFAKKYFEQKGAKVETDEDKDNMICRVVCSGTSKQISEELKKYFGDGNSLSFKITNKTLSLSEKTVFVDNMDLSNILNSANASRPMTYTVHSSNGENIHSLECGGAKSQKVKGSDALMVEVNGGVGRITYGGNIPKTFAIVIYCFVAVIMVIATVYIIMQLMSYQHMAAKMPSSKFSDAPSLSQTTTFNIAELNMLAEEKSGHMYEAADRFEEEKFEFLHKMMSVENDEDEV